MKQLQLAFVALLCLSPAAFAQGSAPVTNQNTLTSAQIEGLTSSLGPTHSSHLVRSGNDCAPDSADPVWGPGNALVGYSCYSNANGS